MLNGIFAGILAQYGMGEGQVELQYVDTDMLATSENEFAEIDKPDDEGVEGDMGWKEKDDYTEFVLLRVHNAPFDGVYSCESVKDVKKWIGEHPEEVNAMRLEVVLLAKEEGLLRELAYMMAFDCHEPITRGDYLGGCYYVAPTFELEYDKGLDNDDLKLGVILHIYYAHTDDSRYFFGKR